MADRCERADELCFGTVEERVVERFVRLHLIGVALEVFLILFAR